MLIHRCDRCGKEEPTMHASIKIEFYKIRPDSNWRYFDLCSDCTEKFLNFMESE